MNVKFDELKDYMCRANPDAIHNIYLNDTSITLNWTHPAGMQCNLHVSYLMLNDLDPMDLLCEECKIAAKEMGYEW